jgi:hypothetical protein
VTLAAEIDISTATLCPHSHQVQKGQHVISLEGELHFPVSVQRFGGSLVVAVKSMRSRLTRPSARAKGTVVGAATGAMRPVAMAAAVAVAKA